MRTPTAQPEARSGVHVPELRWVEPQQVPHQALPARDEQQGVGRAAEPQLGGVVGQRVDGPVDLGFLGAEIDQRDLEIGGFGVRAARIGEEAHEGLAQFEMRAGFAGQIEDELGRAEDGRGGARESRSPWMLGEACRSRPASRDYDKEVGPARGGLEEALPVLVVAQALESPDLERQARCQRGGLIPGTRMPGVPAGGGGAGRGCGRGAGGGGGGAGGLGVFAVHKSSSPMRGLQSVPSVGVVAGRSCEGDRPTPSIATPLDHGSGQSAPLTVSPTAGAHPEAVPATPSELAEQLLAVLTRTGRAHRITDLAAAFDLAGAWDRFETTLDAVPANLLHLTVGPRGFELQAA